MMDTADDEAVFADAAKQMGNVIAQLITDSFGDLNYDRATENMGVFREYMVNFEEPKLYNDFVRHFKNRLLSGEYGDRRNVFWFNHVRKAKLGLIDNTLSDVSKVTPEEAAEVMYRTGRRK